MNVPEPLQKIIDELSKLPTIGRKTAQRLALYLLKTNSEQVDELTNALQSLKRDLKICKTCFNVSVNDECEICTSTKRNRQLMCVVEDVSDILAIERTNEFNGLYHVLGGVLSPLSGTDVSSLKIKELVERVEKGDFEEIILALNPDTEGETTSLYIAKILKSFNVKITRIARGLPVGGDIEFADEATIGRAVLSRILIQ